MQAHALTPLLGSLATGDKDTKIEYPFLSLLVSGKHTMLVHTKSHVNHRIVADVSRSIALGNVLDKFAKKVLPPSSKPASQQHQNNPIELQELVASKFSTYTGTKEEIKKDAAKIYARWKLGNSFTPNNPSTTVAFNFTGALGQAITQLEEKPEMDLEDRRDLAWAFMKLLFENVAYGVVKCLKTDEQLLANPPKTLIMSGGVSSSTHLRTVVQATLKNNGFANMDVVFPTPKFCTDNAVMVAHAGYTMSRNGWSTTDDANPMAKWSIEAITSGVGGWAHESKNGFREDPDAMMEAKLIEEARIAKIEAEMKRKAAEKEREAERERLAKEKREMSLLLALRTSLGFVQPAEKTSADPAASAGEAKKKAQSSKVQPGKTNKKDEKKQIIQSSSSSSKLTGIASWFSGWFGGNKSEQQQASTEESSPRPDDSQKKPKTSKTDKRKPDSVRS